jgi:hypothetical protein
MEGCGRGKQGKNSRSQRRSCAAGITWCWFDVGHAAAALLAATRERQPLSSAHPPVACNGVAGTGSRRRSAQIRRGSAAAVVEGV